MSQAGRYLMGGGGGIPIETITGNTGGPVPPDAGGNINIVGTGDISVTGNAGTNTLTIALAGAVADSFNGNTGTAVPVAGVLNIISATIEGTPRTTGSGNTISLAFTDVNNNIGIGTNALVTPAFISDVTAIGANCLQNNSAGNANNGYGSQALKALTTGPGGNCAFGTSSAANLLTGSFNITLGTSSGFSYTGAESNNICISHAGVLGESSAIHIGTQGAGFGQQNTCFIAGITGVNVGSVANVVSIATGTGQLGTTAITAGTGITVTPGANTITISVTGSGTTTLNYTNVSTTPYVVLTTDEYLSVDTSALSITVQLPNAPSTGRVFIIKDRSGAAFTRNISVTTVGGVVTIDGSTTYTMNTNFASIEVIFNGSNYEVF